MQMFRIGDFEVGGKKTFIIAELSANHNGSLENAKKTIRAAKKAGADAIKLQTYTADTITMDCDNQYFQITQGTLWDGTTLYKLYQEACTPWEWHAELFRTAREEGLICFSSPFDFTAVDLLEDLDAPAYKIASFEITDTNLIEYVAKKGKPMIISTGIATIGDIKEAVDICRSTGNEEIALLKCTSAYPAPLESVNLRTMMNLSETFGVIAGLSDHTMGISVPVGAVALGAKVVEKHVILDRSIGGADSGFSLTMEEFAHMVQAIREIEKAVGTVSYDLDEKGLRAREHSRSLFFVEDIVQGELITEKNMRSIRPGYGLHPRYYREIIGKRTNKDILRGTPVKWEDIQ